MVNLVKTLLYFNPHSHEGSDRIKWKYCGWTQISIHTPTKGATKSNQYQIYHRRISIHTPTKGATKRWFLRAKTTLFQSTLPRRERHLSNKGQKLCFFISIHTPTKGATRRWSGYCQTYDISIHTPTKGATDILMDILAPQCNFNPHSHEGSDRLSDK